MTPTTPRLAPHFLGAEFNSFLFAPVGTDRAGTPLSVVSALARLDIDAWAEAAALARLPRDAAVNKLAYLLRRYPEIPEITQGSAAVAARLIALLPHRATSPRLPYTPPRNWGAAGRAAGFGMLIALAVLVGLKFATSTSSKPPATAPHRLATNGPAAPPQP
jgi:hypothetical protein